MRFSLLSLIAIITLVAFAINLFSARAELRKTQVEQYAIEGLLVDRFRTTEQLETVIREYPAFIAKQQSAYDAREKLQEDAEKIFLKLLPEASQIASRNGIISIREIPTISSVQAFKQGVAIYVPESRRCEIELEYIDDRKFFSGIERRRTFPLRTGRNEIIFATPNDETKSRLRLTINEEVVAESEAAAATWRGYSLQSKDFDPQCDFDTSRFPDIPTLLDFSPMLEVSGTSIQLQFYLRLVEVTPE